MKKVSKSEDRPQSAQIDAILRCLKQNELHDAMQRLLRLQKLYPNFKPLKRLDYEIAHQSGNNLRAVFCAWLWCEASPNSTQAFEALAESSLPEFPFLYLHAIDRLIAQGEPFNEEHETLRTELTQIISEEHGRSMELCRVFLGNERTAEARAFVESIPLPAAQNNVAQSYFAEGKIELAESTWASILKENPEDFFALERVFAMQLWLSGKIAAQEFADRLFALEPSSLDDVCRQLDVAITLDHMDRADTIYLATLEAPWFLTDEPGELNTLANKPLHMAGALIAWRLERQSEALARLNKIEDDSEAFVDLRSQLMFSSLSGDTPNWEVGHVSQWWPIIYIRSLHPEKFTTDEELFEHWQITIPHPDYLFSIALSGTKPTRTLAISGLQHLAVHESNVQDAARQALISLLALPCGTDSIRQALHRWMIENKLLDKDASISLLVGGNVSKVSQIQLTIHDEQMEEETVLNEADHRIYDEAMNLIAARKNAKARQLMETLFLRYPDYPRIMTCLATLREAEGEPFENWALLVRRAAEIAPDYFFARTGLIKLLSKEGRLEEARAELKPLLALTEMHSSEWRALIMAQLEIAKAEADFPALTRLTEMLRDCQERFG